MPAPWLRAPELGHLHWTNGMTLAAPNEIRAGDLLLRRFTVADIDAFGDFLERAENTRFMAFPDEVKTRQAAAAIVLDTIKSYEAPTAAVAMAICRPQDVTIVGACGAYETSETEIEIFFLILQAYRGQGYATRAATALVDHLRATHPTYDLVAPVDPRNVRSQRVLEKIGFRCEGRTGSEEGAKRRYVLAAATGDRPSFFG